MSKRCAKCGTENRDAAKRCMECGQALAAGETPTRLCPAGLHPMDAGWAQCPYCASGTSASPTPASQPPLTAEARRSRTVAEVSPQSAAVPAAPALDPEARRRATVLLGTTPDASAAESRRIVALLVTYTWESAGQVFAIRAGRNLIGGDPHADVYVPSDPQMAGRHATVVCRDDQFTVAEEQGAHGTLVDDEPVDPQRPLTNYAKIKTGGTVFTFIQVDPEAARGNVHTQPFAGR